MWGGKWGGKGKGKGKNDWGPSMLDGALTSTVEALKPLELEWDEDKLTKKLRDYFYKAGKNMEAVDLAGMVNEYADNAFGSLFAGLGDREWLYSGQADFLLMMDAGIKDTFPQWIMKSIKQEEFENIVLTAYERAFDEQRFFPILSEAVPLFASGPKIKKKVWNAVDQGRKDACLTGVLTLDDFTQCWINRSVAHIAQECGGHPETAMDVATAEKFFSHLLTAGSLPLALTQSMGKEVPVTVISEAVASAYIEHTLPEDAWAPGPSSKKRKMQGDDWGQGGGCWGPPDYGGKGCAWGAKGGGKGGGCWGKGGGMGSDMGMGMGMGGGMGPW